MIGFAATNMGAGVIDPELFGVRLFINDEDSLIWGEAIANGHREANWFALPPGNTVSMSWSTLGDSLFPVPGEYALKLRLDNVESPAVVVRLLP